MKETLKGALLIVAAMLIFAFYGIFIRLLNQPSHILVFFNFLITSVILFVFFWFKRKEALQLKGQLKLLILLAIINVLNNFFFFQSFVYTTISNAVLTHYTAPIFVALLAPILLKERIENITIKALILSSLGIFVISYAGGLSFASRDFIGILYGLASGLMYGLVIIYIKKLSEKISVYAVNIYHSFIGSLFLMPFVAVTDFAFNAEIFGLFLLFAFLFGIAATLLHMNGIKRIKSQHAGILAYIEPVAATSYGIFLFSEIPSLLTIVGGILILFSGYLILRRES